MVIEFYDELGKPQRVTARRVVVRTDHEMPLMVGFEYQPGLYTVAHYEDPGFTQALRVLGIDRTQVQIKTLQPQG